MECSDIAGVYKRRKPQETSLWKHVDYHFFEFEERYESVVYRSKMTHGKSKRNFTKFSPLEFMASITQNILEPSFQLVRYYG